MKSESKFERVGKAGLQGWRAGAGDRIADPVAARTPLSADQVRALLGVAFFVLSVVYVVQTSKQIARQLRS
jgi:hypothetical protein